MYASYGFKFKPILFDPFVSICNALMCCVSMVVPNLREICRDASIQRPETKYRATRMAVDKFGQRGTEILLRICDLFVT